MGDTHWRSNLKAKTGAETISGFGSVTTGTVTGTVLVANTSANIPAVNSDTVTAATVTGTVLQCNTKVYVPAAQYIQLGDHQYIFFGEDTTSADIISTATAVDASVKGSMYLDRSGGQLWVMNADTTATLLTFA